MHNSRLTWLHSVLVETKNAFTLALIDLLLVRVFLRNFFNDPEVMYSEMKTRRALSPCISFQNLWNFTMFGCCGKQSLIWKHLHLRV